MSRMFLEQGKRVASVDLKPVPGSVLATEHEHKSAIELDLADDDAIEVRLKPLGAIACRVGTLIDAVSAGRPSQAPTANPGWPGNRL